MFKPEQTQSYRKSITGSPCWAQLVSILQNRSIHRFLHSLRVPWVTFLSIAIVLLIVTGAVFAQVKDGVSFGTWGRAVAIPVWGFFPKVDGVDDTDPVFKTGVGSGWGPAMTRHNASFTAADGRIGGAAEFGASADEGVSVDDNLNIWAKPFGSDILLIKIGKYNQDDFRGAGNGNNFSTYIGGVAGGEDDVFNRLTSKGGALFITKPVTGLSIFAQIAPGWNTFSGSVKEKLGEDEAKDVYKKIQAGIGYDISGIGLARFQWVGNTGDTTWTEETPTSTPARIEAAFKLTAVEGLTVDIGLKVPFAVKGDVPGDVKYTDQNNITVGVAGGYTAGDFNIGYGLYGGFLGKTTVDADGVDDSKKATTFSLILAPNYYVAAIDARLGLEAGFKVEGETTSAGVGKKDQKTIIGFGGWIFRDLGAGNIRTGLGYSLTKEETKSTSSIVWPIILTLSL